MSFKIPTLKIDLSLKNKNSTQTPQEQKKQQTPQKNKEKISTLTFNLTPLTPKTFKNKNHQQPRSTKSNFFPSQNKINQSQKSKDDPYQDPRFINIYAPNSQVKTQPAQILETPQKGKDKNKTPSTPQKKHMTPEKEDLIKQLMSGKKLKFVKEDLSNDNEKERNLIIKKLNFNMFPVILEKNEDPSTNR